MHGSGRFECLPKDSGISGWGISMGEMSSGTESTGRDRGLALDRLQSLTSVQCERLKARWIDSVEALLGSALTPQGLAGLAKLLDLSQEDTEAVVQEARDMLGPDKASRVATPFRGGPTGVVLTDEQKRMRGRPDVAE